MNPSVIIAAGGTGGHMFPARATAQLLQDAGISVFLTTDARGARYVDGFPVDGIIVLDAARLPMKKPWMWPSGFLSIARGTGQAIDVIKTKNVRCVAGFGGYPTVPGLLAAKRMGIATLIHDQNAVPGRVNRLFAGHVDVVACGFPVIKIKSFAERATVVGNPVRADIQTIGPYVPPSDTGPINVLVIGGSQGAKILGQVVPAALAQLPDDMRKRLVVTQQARDEQATDANGQYKAAGITADVAPFFSDMAGLLARAHIVISRAGASSVSELAAAGRPSILVPFAAAMDDHQTANAQVLAGAGAAEIIPEGDLTPEHLTGMILGLLSTPNRLNDMAQAAKKCGRPDAANTLADMIKSRLQPGYEH